MRRKWVAFDRGRMNKEFAAVPSFELGALFEAMLAYRRGVDVAWKIDRYQNGLMRIRNRSKNASGRCVFFTTVKLRAGEETLVALAAYKKEGQSVPTNVTRRAKARMLEWKKANGII